MCPSALTHSSAFLSVCFAVCHRFSRVSSSHHSFDNIALSLHIPMQLQNMLDMAQRETERIRKYQSAYKQYSESKIKAIETAALRQQAELNTIKAENNGVCARVSCFCEHVVCLSCAYMCVCVYVCARECLRLCVFVFSCVCDRVCVCVMRSSWQYAKHVHIQTVFLAVHVSLGSSVLACVVFSALPSEELSHSSLRFQHIHILYCIFQPLTLYQRRDKTCRYLAPITHFSFTNSNCSSFFSQRSWPD